MAWPRFEELSSSPALSINRSGNSVTRRFKVAGADLINFCQYLCDGSDSGWSNAPGIAVVLPNCYVTAIDATPWAGDELHPVPKAMNSPLTDANSYSWWQVSVTYELMPFVKTWPTTMPKPSHDAGTTLSCKIRGSTEYKSFPARLVYWKKTGGGLDTDNPPPIDIPARFLIPMMDIVVTWDLIMNPPIATWLATTGKTNNATYMGFAAESLLLESYDLSESMRLSTVNPYAYSASLNFRYRWVGWNYEFREDPPGWTYILTADSQPRYPLASFSGLFNQ